MDARSTLRLLGAVPADGGPEPLETCRRCGEFERCPCGCGQGWCRQWGLFVGGDDPADDCEGFR